MAGGCARILGADEYSVAKAMATSSGGRRSSSAPIGSCSSTGCIPTPASCDARVAIFRQRGSSKLCQDDVAAAGPLALDPFRAGVVRPSPHAFDYSYREAGSR